MIHVKTNTRLIISSFSNAVMEGNLNIIDSLLKDDGCFDIQDDNLETIEVNKYRFLFWFKNKLKSTSILSVDIDQCLHCAIGNTVLLINNGEFPRKIKDISERSKTGLMFKTKGELITKIKFCYVFAKTENKCVFELNYQPNTDWENELNF